MVIKRQSENTIPNAGYGLPKGLLTPRFFWRFKKFFILDIFYFNVVLFQEYPLHVTINERSCLEWFRDLSGGAVRHIVLTPPD
jgi:hypothetical protein